MLSLVLSLPFWVFCIYDIYFEEKIIPKIYLIVSSLFALTIPFNIFVSLPVQRISYSANHLQFDYSFATFRFFIILYFIISLAVLLVSIFKVIKSKLSIYNKILGVLFFLPGFSEVNDFLVKYKAIEGITLADFSFFFVVIIISINFFLEEQNNHRKLLNINVELEEKINQRTAELEDANRNLLLAATIDNLTGIYNRQELEKRLKQEKERIERYHKDENNFFAILFIDLDNFKFYNDTFGHHVGDLILIEFADILKRLSRNIDFISRFGGDEFVIMLPETNNEGASIFSSRIMDELKVLEYFKPHIENYLKRPIFVSSNLAISCSIGISEFRIDKTSDIETLLIEADKALLIAKRKGKKRFVIWNSDLNNKHKKHDDLTPALSKNTLHKKINV